MVTRQDIQDCLGRLGIREDSALEVHCALSSFGVVEGGPETVIAALQETCPRGSVFMPALRLSPELPLTDEDRAMGILTKIRILPPDCDRSAMGLVADTYRKRKDVVTGEGVFRISGWGRNAGEAASGGLDYVLHHGGRAVLFGVDIYKLTAMHYVESLLPPEIGAIFAPGEAVNRKYPPEEWFIETGAPPVKPWYTIQRMAFERGLIREDRAGPCRVLSFGLWDVVGLYESELKRDPYALYGLRG